MCRVLFSVCFRWSQRLWPVLVRLSSKPLERVSALSWRSYIRARSLGAVRHGRAVLSLLRPFGLYFAGCFRSRKKLLMWRCMAFGHALVHETLDAAAHEFDSLCWHAGVNVSIVARRSQVLGTLSDQTWCATSSCLRRQSTRHCAKQPLIATPSNALSEKNCGEWSWTGASICNEGVSNLGAHMMRVSGKPSLLFEQRSGKSDDWKDPTSQFQAAVFSHASL